MEIERKFLVKELPDISHIEPTRFERYYLYISDGAEERVQRVNDTYSYEKKTVVGKLSRSTDRREITKEEFEALNRNSSKAIIRDSYALSPQLSIKVYRGDYEGLIRAEVEFVSVEAANSYSPESWMGVEISDSPLGRDSRLLQLDRTVFETLLAGLGPV